MANKDDDFDPKEVEEVMEEIEETEKDPDEIENPVEKLPSKKGDYELNLFLSTDGKHTINIKVINPESRHEAVKKATELYDYILTRYGTKQAQAVKEYGKENGGQLVDQNTCKHINVKFFEVKKEGPNKGKWFKSCVTCKKFLGWQ